MSEGFDWRRRPWWTASYQFASRLRKAHGGGNREVGKVVKFTGIKGEWRIPHLDRCAFATRLVRYIRKNAVVMGGA